MKRRKILKKLLWFVALVFILMNVVAFFHAYKFTHFSEKKISKTNADKLSTLQKTGIILFGIDNPRPINTKVPSQKYETITLQSNKLIECWYIKADSAKGTIVLFHGYGGQKSSMLDKSDEFLKMGYNTLLVDFMGSGGSEGNQTTIGFKEAEQVKTCFDYLSGKGEKKVYLFGTSLGAVAIMRSLSAYEIKPRGIMIECPFGSMYQTTAARFKIMKVPEFPMASLLVFWGGVQNGFWAFDHKPVEYAKSINCPTLLLYGEKDAKVSRQEIDLIYQNLNEVKTLRTYPEAGHENYLVKYKEAWVGDVQTFLDSEE